MSDSTSPEEQEQVQVQQLSYALEVCIESLADALTAEAGGATRLVRHNIVCVCVWLCEYFNFRIYNAYIYVREEEDDCALPILLRIMQETCSSLYQGGGLTPTMGLVQMISERCAIPQYVMIRPRPGGFVYSATEVDTMIADIRALKEVRGVKGFVFGCLTEEKDIDTKTLTALVDECEGMDVTFHRAFDECCDPIQALEDVMGVKGVTRILTSGGGTTAEAGIVALQALLDAAGDGIIILPGAGVSESNIEHLKRSLTASEFHSSCKSPVPVDDGSDNSSGPFAVQLYAVDVNKVSAMCSILNENVQL